MHENEDGFLPQTAGMTGGAGGDDGGVMKEFGC